MKSVLKFKHVLMLAVFVMSSSKAFSQCIQIESILVAACTTTPGTEGFNEMVRFKVGPAAINTSNMDVTWATAGVNWLGVVQNATTATKVAAINTAITAAGGCGQLIEPTGGVLPANAEVVLITSFNFSATANVFGAISQNIYVIFQNNPTNTTGHFGNYNATPAIRTLSISFGACSDTVNYERSLLVDSTGVPGSEPGATVNYTPSGTATYTNPGCVAPVDVFEVNAGTTPISACPGTVISLTGTAQGQTAVAWTAASGTFSAATSLNTNYTIPANATGAITLTLTATNSCLQTKTSTIIVNVSAVLTPIFTPVAGICTGAPLAPLPTTSLNGVVGTWSPALNNTATTTYTFTPAVGQCAVSTTLTIAVNSSVTPTFNAVLPICTGTVLAALPTTSINGIIGTWAPILNNTATTVYTFTPLAGQCAVSTTLAITVNPLVIPTFNAVSPICAGGNLGPLPTTSLNNITGTWSPALNNTATTIYTFTPNAGQCATIATLTIVVGAGTIPTFNAIAPICAGTTLAALPTTSLNNINGTWSPALNNIATTTYTFTPNAGQCAVNATLIIVVTPATTIPTFNAVAAICSGEILSALPTTSLNNVTGTWSPALNNAVTTTYTFTPNAGQCAVTAAITITVNPSTTPTFNPVASICSGGNLAPLPTTSLNNITGTWSPALNNTTTTTYTFTPNAGQCAATANLAIAVQDGIDYSITGNCANNDFVFQVGVLANSFDLTGADFNWQNANGASVGLNEPTFNASQYLSSTLVVEQLPLTFSLTVTSAEGCTKTKSFILESDYCNIQRGISPNGDNKNEFFDLADRSVKQLKIFNRYGTIVYSKSGYTNEWHGQSDKGEILPDAAYYYMIEFNGNSEAKTGWIYINQQQ
jgi:gliding motility-associated-like protein